jgi:hypothetical protein
VVSKGGPDIVTALSISIARSLQRYNDDGELESVRPVLVNG